MQHKITGIEKYKVIREFFDNHKSEYVLHEGVENQGNFIYTSNDRNEAIGVAKYYLSQKPNAVLFLSHFTSTIIQGCSQNLNYTDLLGGE